MVKQLSQEHWSGRQADPLGLRDVETSFVVSETRSDEDPEGSTALLRVGRMVLLSVDRLVGI